MPVRAVMCEFSIKKSPLGAKMKRYCLFDLPFTTIAKPKSGPLLGPLFFDSLINYGVVGAFAAPLRALLV